MSLFPRWHVFLLACFLGAIVSVHVTAGLRGVSFGDMWDQGYQVQGVRHSVDTLELTPDGYYYGGFYFLPGYLLVAKPFLSRLPNMLSEMSDAPSRPFAPERYPSVVAAQTAARKLLDAPDFYDQSRRIFVVINALSVLWVFGAARVATGSGWAGLMAAGSIGLAWEYSYHARFVGIDAVLAQFGALVFFCTIAALAASTERYERWCLRLAAVAVGCCVGSKLPGVLLLVPVLGAIASSVHQRGFAARLLRAAEVTLIASAVFVVTTPGVLLDPLHFAADLFRVRSDYNRIPDDYLFSIPSYDKRALAIVEYLSLVLFSPYPAVALPIFGFAVIGAVVGAMQRRANVISILLFLGCYLGFVSLQKLLIVRNLMVTLPPLAILAGIGVQVAWQWTGAFVRARSLAAAALAALFVTQALGLLRSGHSAGHTQRLEVLEQVSTYLDANPKKRFYIAPDLRAALSRIRPEGATSWKSVRRDEAESLFLYASAVPLSQANRRGIAQYFARQYANFDYYPSLLQFAGRDEMDLPIMLLSREQARELKLVK